MSKKSFALISLLVALGVFIVLPSQPVHAATLTAVQTGYWSDPATWGGSVPAAGDHLIIPAGIYVDYSSAVINGGTLDNYGNTGTGSAFPLTLNGTTLNNYGTIVNNDIINNSGVINNYGLITSDANSRINNTGTLNNFGTIFNDGIIGGGSVVNNPSVNICGPILPSAEVPPDDRLNWKHGDTYAILYARSDGNGGPAIHLYCLDDEGRGVLMLVVTEADVEGFPQKPTVNTLVKRDPRCNTHFFILNTGEYQINTGPDKEGKHFAYIFKDLRGADFYFYEFNTADVVG